MKKVMLLVAPVCFVMMMTTSGVVATGCGGGGSGGSGGGGGAGGGSDGGTDVTCSATPAAETAQTVWTKVANPVCNACHSGCPNGQGCAYGDYTDATKMYNALVNQTSILAPSGGFDKVKPNDLAHSTAYLKCACTPVTNPACKAPDGTGIGAAMPYQGPTPITAAQLQTIKDWICRGAPQQ